MIGTCLLDGQPVAGVVGCPFLNPNSSVADLNATGRIVWGCLGLGVHGAEVRSFHALSPLYAPLTGVVQPKPARDTFSVCVTGSRSTPALEIALQVVGADEVIR